MAAIVAAVAAINVVLITNESFTSSPFIPFGLWNHVLVTHVTTVVLLSIVATARHPKSSATWVTTGMNALGIGAVGLSFVFESGVALLFIPLALFGLAPWWRWVEYESRGGRRWVRYYQIGSWLCWCVVVCVVVGIVSLGTLSIRM